MNQFQNRKHDKNYQSMIYNTESSDSGFDSDHTAKRQTIAKAYFVLQLILALIKIKGTASTVIQRLNAPKMM